MCTVTIDQREGALHVTMNRDERRDRPAEIPPRVQPAAAAAPAWLAPRDPAGAGTWIGVNDCGIVACLLNRYPDREVKDDRTAPRQPSRGTIIPELLRHATPDAVLDWLTARFDPAPFAGFTLVLATVGGAWVIQRQEDGALSRRPLADGWEMVTSSSWRQPEVVDWRRRQFADWNRRGRPFHGRLPEFHIEQPEGLREWAPLVERDYAATRSITQVCIDPDAGQARMRYWSIPAADWLQPDAALSLPLRRALNPSRC